MNERIHGEPTGRAGRKVEIADGAGVFTIETEGQADALRLLARLIARGLKQEALAKEAETGQTRVETGRAS